MSNAIIGTGILLKAGDGATPEVFTTVAEITDLKPPSFSRKEIDVSTHNEGQEAKILGMLRKGSVTGTLNWLPTDATHSDLTGMLADVIANTKRNWRIALPPNGIPYWTFPGRVQMFDPKSVSTDKELSVSFVITIDGIITQTDA